MTRPSLSLVARPVAPIANPSTGWKRVYMSKSVNRWTAGFTLIELMIVITIIFILLGLAAGRYDRSVARAREASLKTSLQVMRQAIDNYTLDKQSAPQSLDALQQAGYLRNIPIDPITNQKDWQPQFDEVVLSPDQSGTGMVDVHSNSDKNSPFDGTPYKDW